MGDEIAKEKKGLPSAPPHSSPLPPPHPLPPLPPRGTPLLRFAQILFAIAPGLKIVARNKFPFFQRENISIVSQSRNLDTTSAPA